MPYEKRRSSMPAKRKASADPDDTNNKATTDDEQPPAKKLAPTPPTTTNTTNPITPKPAKDLLTIDINNDPRAAANTTPKSPILADTSNPIYGSQKKGRGGGHNCPTKDAAATHGFSGRCLQQGHAGYCPSCNSIVSFKYGCHDHGWKKDDLGSKPWKEAELVGPVWTPENLEARHKERRHRHG